LIDFPEDHDSVAAKLPSTYQEPKRIQALCELIVMVAIFGPHGQSAMRIATAQKIASNSN
jgi:hypothetical protein